MKLFFVTGNQIKLNEAKAYFPYIKGIKIDLDEIQSLDPKKVMEQKLQEVFKHSPVDGTQYIVDDISFGFDCLNGFPGTFIKWFEESLRGAEDDFLTISNAYRNTGATVTSTLGWTDGVDFKIFINTICGTIVSPRDGVGKGFYTIFVPNGSDKTMSQMTDAERNVISPRGVCFQQLDNYLKTK